MRPDRRDPGVGGPRGADPAAAARARRVAVGARRQLARAGRARARALQAAA